MLAFLCVSTPALRAAVRLPVLLYVSAFRRRRVVLLHVRPSRRHSLFAVAVLLLCAERLFKFAREWRRCRRVVTCATVAVSLACPVG